MIGLTDEQHQAIEDAGGLPVRVAGFPSLVA
jgi:hypothetical protein